MRKNAQKGVTLVELIISIAIIGIISVSFLSLFTMGIRGIAFSGHKSKSQFKAQEAVEYSINGTPVAADPLIDPGVTDQSDTEIPAFQVNFNGGNISQKVRKISVTYTYKGKKVTVDTILP